MDQKRINKFGLRCKKSKMFVSSVIVGIDANGFKELQLMYSPIKNSCYVFHGEQLANDFILEFKLHGKFEVVVLEMAQR